MKRWLVIVLALSALSCSSLLAALAPIAQGSQWLGTVLDVAESGSRAYFARHPHQDHSEDVARALVRARSAVAALDAALAAAESAEDGNVAGARAEALKSYGHLRSLLSELGILTATPPPGGAETDAAPPEPIALPTVAQLDEAL